MVVDKLRLHGVQGDNETNYMYAHILTLFGICVKNTILIVILCLKSY